MKGLLKLFFGLTALASVVLLLYGTMKLYRAENPPPADKIEIDIPGVKVVTSDKVASDDNLRVKANQILAGGGAGLLVSIVGFVWALRRGAAPQPKQQARSAARRPAAAMHTGHAGPGHAGGSARLPDLDMVNPVAKTEPPAQTPSARPLMPHTAPAKEEGPVELPLEMYEDPNRDRR